MTPLEFKKKLHDALGGVAGVSFGLGSVFALVLFWNFLRAPYKRLNEAYQRNSQLETALEKPKSFDVVCLTKSLGLPLNRCDDGSYQASKAGFGFQSILLTNRAELTNVTSLTLSPQIIFTQSDNQRWETSNAIQVTTSANPFAGPRALALTSDTRNPQLWVLGGLPLAMATDEQLQLPMMMMSVIEANEAGTHFENNETCALIIRLAIRTDSGNPILPDHEIPITRSDIKDSLEQLGIQPEPKESNEEPSQ